MEIGVRSAKGEASKINVSEESFGAKFNEGLVHQVVTAYLAGGRAGTSAQKNRSDVRGGGKKPWRQKGTGRARAGTIRSPLWRSGGVTFAARPRDYSQKVNRKMYRAAIRSILSELIRQERLIIVDKMELKQPKTKDLIGRLNELKIPKSALIITDKMDINLELSSRNLHNIGVCLFSEVSPVNLLQYENVLMTADALKLIEEKLV